MKLEMGESLCASYLKHVKKCWLVQTNWKPFGTLDKYLSDAELEERFEYMQHRFGEDGRLFKKNRGAKQLLKQGEVDVIGVNQQQAVYALEVAFHEGGLNYGKTGETEERVLKKMLRTFLLLSCHHSPETKLHIYFVSPKVNPRDQRPLEEKFNALQREWPNVEWKLITNEEFTNEILNNTLEKTDSVSDTSELFVRAEKLWRLARGQKQPGRIGSSNDLKMDAVSSSSFQPIVQDLMTTLLEEHRTLLNDSDIHNFLDSEYCKNELNLKIGNFPLFRREMDGSNKRYWKRLYAGKFYVCSQWWKQWHAHNAASLLEFTRKLLRENPCHPGVPVLKGHIEAFERYAKR